MKHMAVSGPPFNVARMHSWKRRSRICAAICNGSICRGKAAASPVLAPGPVAATPVGSEARVAATAVPGAGPFPSSVAAERMPAMQLSPALWSVRMQYSSCRTNAFAFGGFPHLRLCWLTIEGSTAGVPGSRSLRSFQLKIAVEAMQQRQQNGLIFNDSV
jgi:hypothetical protein